MDSSLQEDVNAICTYLAEGEAWHRRAANQCRKLHIRGWGRWHDAESCGDSHIRTCLEKILIDHLEFIPTLDMSHVVKAENYAMNSLADFKSKHHQEWLEKEKRLIAVLNTAIHASRGENMELYCKLCDIQKEVQNEAMRVELVFGRLSLADWNGHDIGVCSKWIHEYFEEEYKDGCIDFNIG